MRHPATACLVLLAALAFAAPAQARSAITWDFAALVARDYWQARGISMPCEPIPYLLSETEDVEWQLRYEKTHGGEFDMAADLAACRVLITPYAEALRTDQWLSWMYCAEVVHEFGHHAGLDHDYGEVMASDGPVPFGCAYPRQWATLNGWRKPPRWVRRSPAKVRRLWFAGRVWQAQVARAQWLRSRGS